MSDPVRLLMHGPTCDDLGDVYLLDFLSYERFGLDEIAVTCEPWSVMLTAVPVPEPGSVALLVGVVVLAALEAWRDA